MNEQRWKLIYLNSFWNVKHICAAVYSNIFIFIDIFDNFWQVKILRREFQFCKKVLHQIGNQFNSA